MLPVLQENLMGGKKIEYVHIIANSCINFSCSNMFWMKGTRDKSKRRYYPSISHQMGRFFSQYTLLEAVGMSAAQQHNLSEKWAFDSPCQVWVPTAQILTSELVEETRFILTGHLILKQTSVSGRIDPSCSRIASLAMQEV